MNKTRLILIILVVLVLLVLVGVVAYNTFFKGGGQPQVAEATATTVPAPTEPTAVPTQAPPPTEPPTAAPTLAAAGSNANDNASAAEPTATPTEPPPTPTAAPAPVTVTQITETVVITEAGEILKNGSFDQGFAANGVGLNWTEFRTDGAAVNFLPESAEVLVRSAPAAQRISIDKAFLPDQYGGIFQTVDVMPGQVYTLTVYGQIRSGFGGVEASNYGYRLQAAIDQSGGVDWSAAPWVELPWPEQSLNAVTPVFSEFNTQFVPKNDKVTLFVRGWNKWPDGNLGEYSLDDISIVGPVPGRTQTITKTVTVEVVPPPVSTPASGEELIDKPLPTTGFGDDTRLWTDARFWGAVLVLALLTGGAFYRARWRW